MNNQVLRKVEHYNYYIRFIVPPCISHNVILFCYTECIKKRPKSTNTFRDFFKDMNDTFHNQSTVQGGSSSNSEGQAQKNNKLRGQDKNSGERTTVSSGKSEGCGVVKDSNKGGSQCKRHSVGGLKRSSSNGGFEDGSKGGPDVKSNCVEDEAGIKGPVKRSSSNEGAKENTSSKLSLKLDVNLTGFTPILGRGFSADQEICLDIDFSNSPSPGNKMDENKVPFSTVLCIYIWSVFYIVLKQGTISTV